MIRTPLSTVIGGAFWTPEATIVGGTRPSFETVMEKLFANSEQGFWYDPNDLSTMFQDAAGTVPVTAVGQPVGLIRDKSGRNNHAFQTTSASRPILRKNAVTGAYYLEFDGSDDFLVTNNINFTATDKVSLFTGVRKLSDANRAILVELGANGANTFLIQAPTVAGAGNFALTSGASLLKSDSVSSMVAPISAVLTAKADIQSSYVTLIANGGINTPVISDQGIGNYQNAPLYIGRRGGTSLAFNGHIYSLIGIGKLVSDSETAAIEKELAKRAGVTINV